VTYLSAEEFAVLHGQTLTPDQMARVQLVLEMASGMVAEHCDLLYVPEGKDPPATVRGVVFEMTARVRQPERVRADERR